MTTYKMIFGALAFGIMLSAAIVTLIDTPLGWWRWWINESDEVYAPISTNQIALPTLPPTATVQPTPTPSLEQMLKAAESVKTYSEKDRALRVVAQTAVKKGNYDVAIKAGVASPTSGERSKTLNFVARCAALEGLFAVAVDAADKIPIYSIHDSTKIEILSLKSQQELSAPFGSSSSSAECQ